MAKKPECPEELRGHAPQIIWGRSCQGPSASSAVEMHMEREDQRKKKTHPVLHRDDNSDSRRRTYSFSCSKMKQGEKQTVLFKTRNKGWQAAPKCVGC